MMVSFHPQKSFVLETNRNRRFFAGVDNLAVGNFITFFDVAALLFVVDDPGFAFQ